MDGQILPAQYVLASIDEHAITPPSDATTLFEAGSKAPRWKGELVHSKSSSRTLSPLDSAIEMKPPVPLVLSRPQRPHLSIHQSSNGLSASLPMAITAVGRKWVAADEQARGQFQTNTLLKNGVIVTLSQLPPDSKALSVLGIARGFSYGSRAQLTLDGKTQVRLSDNKGRSVIMTKAELARRLHKIGTIIPPGGLIPLSEWSLLCWRAKLAKGLRLTRLLRRGKTESDDFGSLWDTKMKTNATGILLNNVSLVLEEHSARKLLGDVSTGHGSTTSDGRTPTDHEGHPLSQHDRSDTPSHKYITRSFGRSISSSLLEVLAPVSPTHSTNSAELYTASDKQKYLRIEISEGGTTFLPSEAKRVNTPPLKNKGRSSFFFDLDSPTSEIANPME